jgi:AraC-like DNA-binding protein
MAVLFGVKLSIKMVVFYLNEDSKISKLETKYSKKTKIREIICDAYFDGNLDVESAITRLNVSSRQFFRLKQKYIDKCLNLDLAQAYENKTGLLKLW